MLDKLTGIEDRYEEINYKLSEPDITTRQREYRMLMKEYADLTELVGRIREYKGLLREFEDVEAMLAETVDDPEMEAMMRDEYASLKERIPALEEEIRILMTPKDPNDDKNVIVEIRGGVGGEEAALFVGDLFRMYSKYAESRGWTVSVSDSNETELGGFKSIDFTVEGKGAYSRLKYEGGGHRVQRVPETESSGRIHTSAVTVSVTPEMDDFEFDLNMNELKIDTYRSGGAGGQHVNKTDSAIRITHIPTGLVVTCQDERSQLKNKDRAIKIMRSKLYSMELAEREDRLKAEKKSQVGSGDRNSRIRTYNFPQGRVTDHRIGLTLYKLTAFLNGDMDEMINALTTADRADKLGSGEAADD